MIVLPELQFANADVQQRRIYEAEASAINDIQKGILAISWQEQPFDVFICYKETDQHGRRTPDCVLATDLYYQLTREGFKVFFSRITLEDKLGTAYEPYIFAALNSAKVMVVLGTDPEYFNSAWVKNEWSRYLALVKQSDGKKVLIPAYRDMDPYNLPEEFSHLQAQDMNKLGFMQDLIRGIKKLTSPEGGNAAAADKVVESNQPDALVASLVKRVFMFLEDGDWQSADEYCERVLDLDPENAKAYMGKLMVELKVKSTDKLKDQPQPFISNSNYIKAVRFADGKLKAELQSCIESINDRNDNACLEETYARALRLMGETDTAEDCKKAAELFDSIGDFKKASQNANDCRKKAEQLRKDSILDEAKRRHERNSRTAQDKAITLLESIPGWKDADELLVICIEKKEQLREKQVKNERPSKAVPAKEKTSKTRFLLISAILAAMVVAGVFVCVCWVRPSMQYANAVELYESGEYEQAADSFKSLGDYNDSLERYAESTYLLGCVQMEAGDPISAAISFGRVISHGDSRDKIAECASLAVQMEEDYQAAEGIATLKTANVSDTVLFGHYEQDANIVVAWNLSNEPIEWLVLDKQGDRLLLLSKFVLFSDCYYNNQSVMITWEDSVIREKLNGELPGFFFAEAFSDAEKALVVEIELENNDTVSNGFTVDCGNNTLDKLFLLSLDEAKRYFNSNEARIAFATPFAEMMDCRVYDGQTHNNITYPAGAAPWWLRSQGYAQGYKAVPSSCAVGGDGSINEHGWANYDDMGHSFVNVGVRPALWVDCSRIEAPQTAPPFIDLTTDPERYYQYALVLQEAGFDDEAAAVFAQLGDYKDAATQLGK